VVTADLLKVDPGRLTSLERQRVYQLGSTEASWGISDVELLIEARARGGLVTIFGLYLRKNLLQAEEVLPLEAVPVVVRKRRPASPEPTVDAGVPPADGGPGSTTSPQ
jgi:hypothetical protein